MAARTVNSNNLIVTADVLRDSTSGFEPCPPRTTTVLDNQRRMATVIEGVEVVRSIAVSYATPMLQHLYLQSSVNSSSTTKVVSSNQGTAISASSIQVKSENGKKACLMTSKEECASATIGSSQLSLSVQPQSLVSSTSTSVQNSRSSNLPLWVFSPSFLSSPSFVIRPAAPTFSKSSKCNENSVSSAVQTVASHVQAAAKTTFSCPSLLSEYPLSSLSISGNTIIPCHATSSVCVTQPRSDDELTSLSWLQDSNLLSGTALSQMKANTTSAVSKSKVCDTTHQKVVSKEAAMKPISKVQSPVVETRHRDTEVESPTSDYAEETNDVTENELIVEESGQVIPIAQDPFPYNPQIHIKSKPPYSFSSLIFMAIEDSREKALPVKDIYSWVIRHFPYYKNAPTGWKNSVRHNLSLNKCFRKVDKSPNLGKGSLWMVDPAFRPNLIQALSKTPFPPANKMDHLYVASGNSLGDPRNHLEHLASLKVEDDHKAEENIEHPCAKTDRSALSSRHVDTEEPAVNGTQSCGNLFKQASGAPDPELFPRLARRLESVYLSAKNKVSLIPEEIHRDDVDAAAAMLVLKHGPMILQPGHPSLLPETDLAKRIERTRSNMSNESYGKTPRKRKQSHNELVDPSVVFISTSPSVDHAYVCSSNNGTNLLKDDSSRLTPGNVKTHRRRVVTELTVKEEPKGKHNSSPSSSVDEAFSDESFDSESTIDSLSRIPFAEADALLNLASVATSLASRQNIPQCTQSDKLGGFLSAGLSSTYYHKNTTQAELCVNEESQCNPCKETQQQCYEQQRNQNKIDKFQSKPNYVNGIGGLLRVTNSVESNVRIVNEPSKPINKRKAPNPSKNYSSKRRKLSVNVIKTLKVNAGARQCQKSISNNNSSIVVNKNKLNIQL